MRKGPTILVGAATLLGLLIRLDDLGRIGLGSDEAHSAWMASQPLGSLGALLRVDSAPPLYYAVLSGWQSFFPGDAGLRSLSVLLGTAAIPLLYLIGRRLAGEAAGVASAFFMAVSNLHIEFSQMAKGYALYFLLTQAALLALVTASQRPERRLPWVAAGLAMAGILHTHAVGPLVVAGLAATGALLLGRGLKRHWKPFVMAHGLAALLFAPWATVAIPQARAVVGAFWAPVPTLTTPLVTLQMFLLKIPSVPAHPRPRIPEARPGITGLPFMENAIGPTRRTAWVVLPAVALVLAAAVAAGSPPLRRLLAPLALVAVPMALLFVVSRTVGSVYLHRALLPTLSAVPLLLSAPFAAAAGGTDAASRFAPGWLVRAARWTAAGSFALMLATGWHFTQVRVLPAWDLAAEYVSAGAHEGDAIVYDFTFGEIPMERYLRGTAASLPSYGLPSDWYGAGTPTMGLWVRTEADLGRLREAAASHRVIWFVRSHTAVHDPGNLGLKWCRANLVETEMRAFAFVDVYRFESKREPGA